jgi:hypothetical protein
MTRSMWFKVTVLALVLGSALLVNTVGVSAQGKANKRDQIQSNLKNAATAEESWRTTSNSYTKRMADLESEGFSQSKNVRLLIVRAGENGYCLEAQHDGLGEIWKYSSKVGAPRQGQC